MFVFSPRFGSTLLIGADLVRGKLGPALLGFKRRGFAEALADPARDVRLVGAFEKEPVSSEAAEGSPKIILLVAYSLFHLLRGAMSFPMALRLARWLGSFQSERLSIDQIGGLVLAIERRLGVSDCYPRALLTTCLAGGTACQVTIGILAPTTKLHAWCSIDGIIPYEPVNRHWWYSPLVVADVTQLQFVHAAPMICGDGSVHVALRPSVAVRRVVCHGREILYLSLFEDEIDNRLECLLKVAATHMESPEDLASAALALEPTDAVIVLLGAGTLVARGGACSFPLYWTRTNARLDIAVSLPIDEVRRFSLSGLADSIAVVCVALQNEPNLSLRAPVSGWRRLRRGAVSSFSNETDIVSETPIDFCALADDSETYDSLLADLWEAVDQFGRRQGARKALVELSGGFDSTLAAVAARRHGTELVGVSVYFPYYEFRFEEELQQAVAFALGIPRQRLNGADFFSYTPTDSKLKLDEPATICMAFARDLEIARIAAAGGLSQILVGQGGDQLFSEHMLAPMPAPSVLTRGAFTTQGWRNVEAARARMERQRGFLRRSRLTYLHDARLDPPIKEALGVVTRTPFSDVAVVRCGMRWARLCAKKGVNEGKRVLADAFAADLPDAVLSRRAKVAWDGVLARTYAKNADALGKVIENAASILQHVGFDVRWLMRRLVELAQWRRTSFGIDDRELFVAYAVAAWLGSWGVTRIADASWTD